MRTESESSVSQLLASVQSSAPELLNSAPELLNSAPELLNSAPEHKSPVKHDDKKSEVMLSSTSQQYLLFLFSAL